MSQLFDIANVTNEFYNKPILNGINVSDSGLVLGKIALIDDIINNIVTYDIIIIGSYIAIVTIFVMLNKVPQKYKAFKQEQSEYCQVKPQSESK